MIQKIFQTIILTAIFLFTQSRAYASEISEQSAQLEQFYQSSREDQNKLQKELIHTMVIRNVLAKYNSPLVHEAEHFTMVARALKLDPYLLPSITGVESTFAQHMIQGTFNPFGYGKGTIRFTSWSDGISRVGYALKFRYMDKGATSLHEIGHIYAGGSTTWAPKVARIMNTFDEEEERINRYYELL
ncbi:hypothetical protein A3C24_03495 [Candidatus Roizmanbacteria bacterium RIFCSPHIGHO2_02_FULL_37_24]|uniref:Mannosyl-glycoprotein endo-beta-N-acetylglucosamidase-like domain-containing protein n=1 Tax=Candidatus Roizmanbacteria bacterium RIFCSPHIGHO2_02_FULL_37_24 TaxID=1802037 RepID=A0A1F7GVI1_9BACT|nr:MAG: hypothetical protein A3C24_03495 [Candidatus Roizmanbacteria bacterium RIFCSPHIGHO2_02_FULL_37_24]OGK33646.1 MAG: hypothetical protein A3E10_05290 [Candidatus Roizmanbacteria bacterium RIFCSPHIGHO2_12_FULL_37_23]OGK44994.1 MAG: hypothetical protein A2956_00440 [Candidatus Roizmanbacteria bacterium RIFCSPLOWO2_01_FULL_37_57]OGK58947.1 MAG: hypothetical protein A3G65_04370 [Candidatus Roizmanbacteria bacterium RIFCSPLOWO2_12_FULL_37_7b]